MSISSLASAHLDERPQTWGAVLSAPSQRMLFVGAVHHNQWTEPRTLPIRHMDAISRPICRVQPLQWETFLIIRLDSSTKIRLLSPHSCRSTTQGMSAVAQRWP